MLEVLQTVAVGVAAGSLLVTFVGVAASALGVADYWPPGKRNWAFYVQWTLSHAFSVSLLIVAVLDWGSLGLPRLPTLAAGAILFVPGFVVALAAGRDLGSEETVGLTGELRTDGWYRYSRNPQYVGYVVATLGFALLTNSTLAGLLCLAYVGWWLALPFAEEPWLREQYGAAYERYAERVPRFVGVRTIRALREASGAESSTTDPD